MFIIQLPDYLLSELFSEWIELKDVAKFDSSLTNLKFRQSFLEVINREDVSFSASKIQFNIQMIYWLNIRGAKPREVGLNSVSVVHSFKTTKVTMITIENQIDQTVNVANFINLCPHLKLISFNGADADDDLFSQINPDILKQLTELHHVGGWEMKTISKYCTQLIKLIFSGSLYDSEAMDGLQMVMKNNKMLKTIVFNNEIDGYLLSSEYFPLFHSFNLKYLEFSCNFKDDWKSFIDTFTSVNKVILSINNDTGLSKCIYTNNAVTICSNNLLTHAMVTLLTRKLPHNIKGVELSKIRTVTCKTIQSVLIQNKALTSLHCNDCDDLCVDKLREYLSEIKCECDVFVGSCCVMNYKYWFEIVLKIQFST